MPFFLCLWRVIKRRFKYNNRPRPDLPEGCPEKLHFPYILKVLAFPLRGYRLFFKKYKEIQARQRHKEEETTLLWFKSSKEVEAFLRRLSIQSQEEYENVEEPSGGICSSQKDILTHIVYYILQELKRGGRRRWDSNPRELFTLHDFQSCSLGHYETPPCSGESGIRTHEGYSPYRFSRAAHSTTLTSLRGPV